jgi:hypothetical protein
MQDVTNYELWVASGIGCSICNPYYHEKFDVMGRDGLYFDDLSYCSNFYRNSNNYLNAFRNMRFVQHNLNVILNFLKVAYKEESFGTLNDKTNFMIWLRHHKIKYRPELNPQNIWRYGLKFGIEYSSDKLLSQKAKVNNCIEEIKNKNFSNECQDICLQTNPPNEVTISTEKFVINLLMAEYIIDSFWKKEHPDYYSDYVFQTFPEFNMDTMTNNSQEKPEGSKPKKPMLLRKGAITDKKKLTPQKENTPDQVNVRNDFNLVKYYYDETQKMYFGLVFKPKTTLGNRENKSNFIQFEELDKDVVSSKASWVPFPNSMNYENVRVTYYDHEPPLLFSLQMLALMLLFFKFFN